MSFPRNVKNAVDWGTSGQQELRSAGGQQAHKLKQRQTLQRRVGCLLFSVIMFTCLLDIHLLSPPFANQKESFGSEEVKSRYMLSLMASMMSALHTSQFQRPYFSGQEYPGDHSYITSALVGGEGGVRKCQFLLILSTKNMLTQGGRGSKNPKNVMT